VRREIIDWWYSVVMEMFEIDRQQRKFTTTRVMSGGTKERIKCLSMLTEKLPTFD
jgi:hypothetical protein